MELYNLSFLTQYCSGDEVKEDEACPGESGNTYVVLPTKCEVKRTLGRPRY